MESHDIRIMLIDDDEDDYIITRDLLSDLNEQAGEVKEDKFELDWVATYEAGLVAIEQNQHDVYLIDYRLGGRSGLELLRDAIKRGCSAPLILLTGQGDRVVDIEAMKAGAADYLVKGQMDAPLLERSIRYAIERKRAAEALRASEERLHQVITSISDHIYMTELTEAGSFVNRYLSPNIETLTGYPLENFIDNNWHFWPSFLIHPDDRAAAAAQLERLVKGYNSEIEYRLIRADGQVIWVRDNARVQVQGNSKIIYGVVGDITKSKQLEEQFRQSQKMDALGKLASGVAHDFNNILTVILGHSEILLERTDCNASSRKDVEQIQQAGERAASLTRQLLAFSRQQMLQPRLLDLNAIVLNIEQMLRRLLGADIELVTILESRLKPVKADPGQIDQVILNLAINARDAMPKGGKLTIETANVYLDDTYVRQRVGVTAGLYMMLAVSDTGIGMDKETQSRIFEPFFTTKEPGKGTGLGLAMVHGIVNQSGGSIWVYSEVGKGTTFKVYLPQVIEAPASASPHQDSTESYGGSETILLVEDEDMVRELAHRVLLQNGYKILEAHQGEEAIQICEQYQAPIHLLLTDVVMPGKINGPQLAEQLVLQYPEVKILYMSGYTDKAIINHGLLGSDIPFLQKPFTPNALRRKVREVLGRKTPESKVS
jgi:PAS domain S-box-containing protein